MRQCGGHAHVEHTAVQSSSNWHSILAEPLEMVVGDQVGSIDSRGDEEASGR